MAARGFVSAILVPLSLIPVFLVSLFLIWLRLRRARSFVDPLQRMTMLGFAIVGCGMIARFHVRALNEIPGTRLAALYDQIPASAEKLQKEVQEQWNIRCDTAVDLGALVKHKDVDIVIITTPSGNHMEPAVAAAQAGKHVVVDKPFAVTVEEADALIALAEERGRLLTVFHNRRWDSDFLTVRKVLPQPYFAYQFRCVNLCMAGVFRHLTPLGSIAT